MKALLRAIEVCGGQTELARAIGVPPQQVWNWVNRDKKVPAEYCRAIESAAEQKGGRDVTRYALRPDVFGKSAEAA
jgi:DNA-binding transcriptional regulator YdaS (Cro superfamily)